MEQQNKINLIEELENIAKKYKKNFLRKDIKKYIESKIKVIGGSKFNQIKEIPLHIKYRFEYDLLLSLQQTKKIRKRLQEIEQKAKIPYHYSERLGKNSVGIIVYNQTNEKFGLIREIKPPLYQDGIYKLSGVAGGSLDKNKSKEEIVLDEVKEEFGYKTKTSNIIYINDIMSSSQTSEIVSLYLVKIENKNFIGKNLEIGEDSEVLWYSLEELNDIQDAKVGYIINNINSLINQIINTIININKNNYKEEITKLKKLQNNKFYYFINKIQKLNFYKLLNTYLKINNIKTLNIFQSKNIEESFEIK